MGSGEREEEEDRIKLQDQLVHSKVQKKSELLKRKSCVREWRLKEEV